MGEKKQSFSFIFRALHLFIWLLILYAFFLLWPFLQPILHVILKILTPLLLAGLFAYILHPLIDGLHQWKLPRMVAILLVFGLFLTGLVLGIMYGVPVFIRQVQDVMQVLPGQVERVMDVVHTWEDSVERMPFFLRDHLDDWSDELIIASEKWLDRLETGLLAVLKSIPSLVVIPFLVFYFLKDISLIKKTVWYLTPTKWRKPLALYGKDVDHTFGSYIRGQMLVAAGVATLSIIGLWIVGVPYSVLLGLFIGGTNIIPYFGAIIGMVPALIAALLISWEKALYTLIILAVIQQIEGNVLSPLIVGRTLHLHPLFIILALLVGVELGGIIGLLLAVPLLAVLKVTLLHVRQHFQND
ncbi:AI-2E family transporter [Alkalihalobacillus sp. FSL R5-0424]